MTIDRIHEIMKELTQVVRANGHHQHEGSAIPKQLLYLADLIRIHNIELIGEIGFNAGLSSYVFLDAIPDVRVISFDLGQHPYVKTAKRYIDQRCPGRHTLICGDSKQTVPAFKAANPATIFDLVFIDGGHDYQTAKADIINLKSLCNEKTVVVMDDLLPDVHWGVGPSKAWNEAISAAIVTEEEILKDSHHVEETKLPEVRRWARGKYLYKPSGNMPDALHGQQSKSILDVYLTGDFAEKMIQSMVASRIAAEVGDCYISNAVFPEWGIAHPRSSGAPGPAITTSKSHEQADFSRIVQVLSSGEKPRVSLLSCAPWFPNLPELDLCRGMFPANESEYPGFGEDCLVCNIEVQGDNPTRFLLPKSYWGSESGPPDPHRVLLPLEFYEELARNTGLKLVFMGQIEDNAYCRALRQHFPEAVFRSGCGLMADFQTFRNSKNLVPAVGIFSWLAAWLSHAKMIVLPVNGLFHPVQCPEVDLLPAGDERYQFYLFPINYAVPTDQFQETHRVLRDRWGPVDSETLRGLRTPRHPKRLASYVAMFDEEFYLEAHHDVVQEVRSGRINSGLDHYMESGFRENRECFRFDPCWYSIEYPEAASQVGRCDYADLAHHYVEIGASHGYAPRAKPVLDAELAGSLGDRMIQYITARKVATEFPGSKISGAALPEWGIRHPVVPGIPGPRIQPPKPQLQGNVAWIASLISSREKSRITLGAFLPRFANFPELEFCRNIFPANESQYPGFGAEYLVCHIEISQSNNPHCVLLPVGFYEELARSTGLKLVFTGQVEENAYFRALRERFPGAEFQPSRGPVADFQMFRNSRNLVPAVSVFSWLAAWLSQAEMIAFPISGMFHPVQCPDIDLLPSGDKRYRFYLFPINYAAPGDRFEEAHNALQNNWRYVRPEAVTELRTATPRQPKRLDLYAWMFDEAFYLHTYPDIAKGVATGGLKSGLDHFVRVGFTEGDRRGFAFDDRWYSVQYPIAALEVGAGDYSDLRHHYVEVGALRGYQPVPSPQKASVPVSSSNGARPRIPYAAATRIHLGESEIRKTTIEEGSPLTGDHQFRIGRRLRHLDRSRHYPCEFGPAMKTVRADYCSVKNVVFDSQTGALFKHAVHIGEAFYRGDVRQHRFFQPRRGTEQLVGGTVIVGFNIPSITFCYFHWITQCIPSMYWASKICDDKAPALALPPLKKWQEEALSLAGLSGMKRHPISAQQEQFDHLAYTTLMQYPQSFNNTTRLEVSLKSVEVFRLMRSRVEVSSAPANSVVYVSRADAPGRVMSNEAELCALLEAEGVDVFVPGNHSVEEQIRKFASAKAVVGPHGAGLTNIAFCDPGATVYELIPDLSPSPCYSSLAQALGMNYWAEAFPCHLSKDKPQGWSWTVNLQEVLNTARMLIELPPVPRS